MVVRIAFVVLATAFVGVVAYALLWLTMPATDEPLPARPRTVPGTHAPASRWSASGCSLSSRSS